LSRSQASPGKTITSSSLEDGHTWRKYGQKMIQGSSQFRCGNQT
jgi:WRKY DNA -binding domain